MPLWWYPPFSSPLEMKLVEGLDAFGAQRAQDRHVARPGSSRARPTAKPRQPARQRRAGARPDVERTRAIEQPLEPLTEHTRGGQRIGVARHDQASIGVGGAVDRTDRFLAFDEGHEQTLSGQVVGTGGTDDATADYQDVRLAAPCYPSLHNDFSPVALPARARREGYRSCLVIGHRTRFPAGHPSAASRRTSCPSFTGSEHGGVTFEHADDVHRADGLLAEEQTDGAAGRPVTHGTGGARTPAPSLGGQLSGTGEADFGTPGLRRTLERQCVPERAGRARVVAARPPPRCQLPRRVCVHEACTNLLFTLCLNGGASLR